MLKLFIEIELGQDLSTLLDAIRAVEDAPNANPFAMYSPLRAGESGTILDEVGTQVGTWRVIEQHGPRPIIQKGHLLGL